MKLLQRVTLNKGRSDGKEWGNEINKEVNSKEQGEQD
jgi:hypothetical protein